MDVTPPTVVWTREAAEPEKRDVWSAMKRGFRSRCPRCGKGRLFRKFLKCDGHCPVCDLDFTPHRRRRSACLSRHRYRRPYRGTDGAVDRD
ncbi:putative amidophosphoribosyltransferase [Bradyrhizobium sp. USDA 4524]